MTRAVLLAVMAIVAFAWPTAAGAHERSVSYSFWKLEERGGHVRLRVPARELTRLPLAPDAAYFTERLRLLTSGGPCRVEADSFRAVRASPGWEERAWRLECDGPPSHVETSFLLDVAPRHLHFARLRDDAGTVGGEQMLTAGRPKWSVGAAEHAAAATSPSLGDYVLLGIEHIVTGYDHLVFLLALVLVARRLRQVVGIVTGFTVGHSVTLGLAALGTVAPVTSAVEALIGLSIALVAAENVWLAGGRRGIVVPLAAVLSVVGLAAVAAAQGRGAPVALLGSALFASSYFVLLGRAARPGRLRWGLATLFGLVHGFGFAGVLLEISLPPSRALPALFSFNVGVELGQLACVALVWPVLGVLRRRGAGQSRRLVAYGSAFAACAGVFWVVQRTLQPLSP